MSSTNQPQEPSPEELKAYVERLREADATEILVQAFTMLGTGAEVKLGRPDARLLIDAMAGLSQAAAPRVTDDLAKGMHNGVAQLQMAQVQMERQMAQESAGGAGDEAAAQQGSPQGAPAGQGAGSAGQGQAAPAGQQRQAPPAGQRQAPMEPMTDRLWIPGRDPGPRRPRP